MIGPITVKTLLRWIDSTMDRELPAEVKSCKLAMMKVMLGTYTTPYRTEAARCKPILPEDGTSIPEMAEDQLIEAGDYLLFLKRMFCITHT